MTNTFCWWSCKATRHYHMWEYEMAQSVWRRIWHFLLKSYYTTLRFFLIFIYLVLGAECGIFSVAACELLVCGIWDLVPWPQIEPRPPALVAKVSATGPPEKFFYNFTKVTLHINLLLDPAIPLLKIYPNDIMVEIPKGT